MILKYQRKNPSAGKSHGSCVYLLYRHKCFTGKFTTRQILRKLYLVIFRITSDVFSISSLVRKLMRSFPAFLRLFMQTVSENDERQLRVHKIKRRLHDPVKIYFLVLKQYFTHSQRSLARYCFYTIRNKIHIQPLYKLSTLL